MRRLYVPDLPEHGDVLVTGDEARHLVKVLRARAGGEVALFDGRGREVAAEVVSTRRDEALVRIVAERVARRAARDVLVATAMPRGKRMEWLVEKCTEAGAARILPVVTSRGVRERAGPRDRERWRKAAVAAAKQCGRADLPEISAPLPLADALCAAAGRAAFVLHPGGDALLAHALPPAPAPVALFVGPEGGHDDGELAALREAGAARVGLGPLLLRVETAAAVAVHTAAQG